MSSEKFNIDDIKSEPEQKQKVKFVVDELGLNTALPKIPTDVEYFINKQRGVGESTASFGQLFNKATEIENTGVVLYNKFSDGLSQNFKADPTYQVTKEQFDELKAMVEELTVNLSEVLKSKEVELSEVKEKLSETPDAEPLKHSPENNKSNDDFYHIASQRTETRLDRIMRKLS